MKGIIFSIPLILFIGFLFPLYVRCRHEKNIYRLKALKDELRLLAFRGKTTQESIIYQKLLTLANTACEHAREFTFWGIVKFVRKANRSTMEEAKQEMKNIFHALPQENIEVRRWFVRFLLELGTILYQNSLVIRIIVRFLYTKERINEYVMRMSAYLMLRYHGAR